MESIVGSGVGVLDKAIAILNALEAGPLSLAELVAATKIARPTCHRLAVALEHHRFIARDLHAPALTALRDATGESAQIYRRQGDLRLCVAVADRLSGLRDSVPVGSALTMQAGSAAQVLLAWEEPDRINKIVKSARFDAATLTAVRRRGWAQSVGEREAGVASVSAPIRGPHNRVIAAISLSGPIERLGRQPGRTHAAAVIATAARISEFLSGK